MILFNQGLYLYWETGDTFSMPWGDVEKINFRINLLNTHEVELFKEHKNYGDSNDANINPGAV